MTDDTNTGTPEHSLGRARELYRSGQAAEARTLCEEILCHHPRHADTLHLLGVIALKDKDADTAIRLFNEAISIQVTPACLRNLVLAYHAKGDIQQAEVCLQRMIALYPAEPSAHQMLASLYQQQAKTAQAEATYKRLIELQPNHAEALNALGALYHSANELQLAADCYRRAVEATPDFVAACNNLGAVLQQMDRAEEAANAWHRALELEPGHPLWDLRIAALCPSVAATSEESDYYREHLIQKLDSLAANGFRASPEEFIQTGVYPPYALMYQGRDDRPVREAWARMAQPCFPSLTASKIPTGQRRIGFVVTRSHEAIFARSLGGVLRHMQHSGFELTVICAAGREQFTREKLACPHVHILPIPEPIMQAARTLQEAHFDILYYWEIATDPLNYYLPFLRLAPIQCTSWGIQVTSGIPNVDYYLSSQLVEPPNADQHYTEKLLQADTLLTYQYRSRLPQQTKQRSDFGFGDDCHLYLFPQQIGKFHPDFDAIVGSILRRDPKGRLVILRDRWPRSAERLQARLSRSITDVADRIIFLPRQNHADYQGLIATSEVLLDPPHYGGVNSTYDGLSLSTPILTCESDYHIGRYTAGCYRKMGLDDCIAADAEAYVELAVELGTNPARRAEFSTRIREASPALFEDTGAIREHERLFEAMLEQLEP